MAAPHFRVQWQQPHIDGDRRSLAVPSSEWKGWEVCVEAKRRREVLAVAYRVWSPVATGNEKTDTRRVGDPSTIDKVSHLPTC